MFPASRMLARVNMVSLRDCAVRYLSVTIACHCSPAICMQFGRHTLLSFLTPPNQPRLGFPRVSSEVNSFNSLGFISHLPCPAIYKGAITARSFMQKASLQMVRYLTPRLRLIYAKRKRKIMHGYRSHSCVVLSTISRNSRPIVFVQ